MESFRPGAPGDQNYTFILPYFYRQINMAEYVACFFWIFSDKSIAEPIGCLNVKKANLH